MLGIMQTGSITAPPNPILTASHPGAVWARPGLGRDAEPVTPPMPVRRLFGDAEGLFQRRRAGGGAAADAEAHEDRRRAPSLRPAKRVFATSAYLSQVMGQIDDSPPAPKTPHRQGVAAYPSLALSVEVFAPGVAASSSGHVIDLLA